MNCVQLFLNSPLWVLGYRELSLHYQFDLIKLATIHLMLDFVDMQHFALIWGWNQTERTNFQAHKRERECHCNTNYCSFLYFSFRTGYSPSRVQMCSLHTALYTVWCVLYLCYSGVRLFVLSSNTLPPLSSLFCACFQA